MTIRLLAVRSQESHFTSLGFNLLTPKRRGFSSPYSSLNEQLLELCFTEPKEFCREEREREKTRAQRVLHSHINKRIWKQIVQVQIIALLITNCVILDKLLSFSVPQSSHL